MPPVYHVLYAVYEPRYLSLFHDLQASAPAGSEPKFGHILAAGSAPPALMQDSVGGLPNTGVCATVKSVEDLGDGRLLVSPIIVSHTGPSLHACCIVQSSIPSQGFLTCPVHGSSQPWSFAIDV